MMDHSLILIFLPYICLIIAGLAIAQLRKEIEEIKKRLK